jgi:3-hydroxybutyryl-CoA dehydratase
METHTFTPELGAEVVTRARTITEADLLSFASLTGDWHPQHADAEWAAAGHFGERVAHGMMLLSYAVGLMPFDPERVVALRGLDSVTFKRPVRIGDTIRLRSKVASVRPLDDAHSLVGLAWRIVNQHDQAVARARVEVLWRNATEAPASGANGVAAEEGELYAGSVLL